MLAPGVEVSSGSLGHGLAIAVGSALTGRRVYCLVGDGELDEGSNWEAVQWAGRIELGSLTTVAVDNHSSRTTGPAASKRDSSSKAGQPHGSTDATTTRSSTRSAPATACDPHLVVAEVLR